MNRSFLGETKTSVLTGVVFEGATETLEDIQVFLSKHSIPSRFEAATTLYASIDQRDKEAILAVVEKYPFVSIEPITEWVYSNPNVFWWGEE